MLSARDKVARQMNYFSFKFWLFSMKRKSCNDKLYEGTKQGTEMEYTLGWGGRTGERPTSGITSELRIEMAESTKALRGEQLSEAEAPEDQGGAGGGHGRVG